MRMKEENKLHQTCCALCGTLGNADEIYPANFSIQDLNPGIFSARRIPDKIHYRIVRCKTCGLVRSDPVIDQETVAELYKKSSQNYDAEVENLMVSYANYLARVDAYQAAKGNLLEIGCGNGFFLIKALERGYQHVAGVEPSQSAVAKSPPQVRDSIYCDILHPGMLPPEQFDVICMFQVFDHIAEPEIYLDECRRVLKPGGLILCLNHDVEALSARILRERSPIIDIEHTYLYSKDSIQKVFSKKGFAIKEIGSAKNIYSLLYLFQLVPLSKGMKKAILSFLKTSPIGKIKMSIELGNLYLIAQKPF